MTDFTKMAREASKRRKTLARQIAKARQELGALERERDVLDQVLGALSGGGRGRRRAARRGRKPGRRRGGKWRPGKPGRPPKWWVEQQKGAKGAAKPGKRRRRGKARGAKAGGAAPAG